MKIYEDASEDTLVSTREVAEVKVTGSVWRHKVDIQSRFDHRHILVPYRLAIRRAFGAVLGCRAQHNFVLFQDAQGKLKERWS